jgi:hypothetical protein
MFWLMPTPRSTANDREPAKHSGVLYPAPRDLCTDISYLRRTFNNFNCAARSITARESCSTEKPA